MSPEDTQENMLDHESEPESVNPNDLFLISVYSMIGTD